MTRSNFTKALSLFGVFIVAITFIGLGLWQWNRAQENRKPVVINRTLISLEKIAQPRSSLKSTSLLRNVTAIGKYVSVFKAPNQTDAHGATADWEVDLFETGAKSAILVVRGLWADRDIAPEDIGTTMSITGTLLPHQNDDYAEPHSGILQRIDSSVIVNQTADDLYDGYIVVSSETSNGIQINRKRISPPTPRSAVPGFYWQHISYVIIWWFMSGVVLYLPFYDRRVHPDVEISGVNEVTEIEGT